MNKILFFAIAFCLLVQACNWTKETSVVGETLAEHFDNDIYKKFDTAVYNKVFLRILDTLSPKPSNPSNLKSFYDSNDLNPELITNFYTNGGLDSLENYISKSSLHGYNKETFGHKKLNQLLRTLKANQFKSIEEVYPVLAHLEISSAEALIKYHNFIYYGSLNPRKIFRRYYIPVKRPDSSSIVNVLGTKDIVKLLQEIQPRSSGYTALQQALLVYEKADDVQAVKVIKINLERLRWKLPETGLQHVEVNIPDFSLSWINNEDTLIRMKVCVGGKKEKDYENKINTYLKTRKLDDQPRNHETPILFSKLNSVQVNPIWNIPASIAKSEIYYQALRNPYYLSDNNIKVYLRGKLVNDPDTIQWNKYSRQKLPFQFKQGSGNINALGKFKFVFDSGSSIYLHDTNRKSAFNLKNRAISHGCIRIEKPLEFAQLLVSDKYQYDQMRMEVNLPPLDTNKMAFYKKKLEKKKDTLNEFELKPKWFGVKKQVPLIINYTTAWTQNGHVEFRPDIYGLDEILWGKLQKYL